MDIQLSVPFGYRALVRVMPDGTTEIVVEPP